MSTRINDTSSVLPPLPDPIKQPWEWAVLCALGDERALAIQRQRQRSASDYLRRMMEHGQESDERDDNWDILEALNETRLAAGRPPLFEKDDEGTK